MSGRAQAGSRAPEQPWGSVHLPRSPLSPGIAPCPAADTLLVGTVQRSEKAEDSIPAELSQSVLRGAPAVRAIDQQGDAKHIRA